MTNTQQRVSPRQPTALVVGGSSGYGRGIAQALHDDGHEVFVASRTPPAGPLASRHIAVDVRELEQIEAAQRRLPEALDVVVYSAGKAIGKAPIRDGTYGNWMDVFQVNTLGLMAFLKIGHEALLRARGLVVHIGSIAFNFSYAGGADYCGAKAAASSIMRAYRHECLGTGIRSVSIEPGLGNTEFQLRRYDGDAAMAASHFKGVRQLEPEDLGRFVCWLRRQPDHINFDEVVVKPLDQITHGVTVASMRDHR